MKSFACILAVAFATTLTISSGAVAAEPAALVHRDHPDNPGKAKGHSKPDPTPEKGKGKKNPSNDKSNSNSNSNNGHGSGKAGSPANNGSAGGTPKGDQGPSPKSRNENKKITYCHVPPGNPANGHLITTSVNAVVPGHTNHGGDIIPPFAHVKHGETVTFAGQNWDDAGRTLLNNGCGDGDDAGRDNENQKVTFCHVPPGNPANGHLITTSVNAVVPGHTNHGGDIIPPFTYVKHGETVTFAGQNWDDAGLALLDRGCLPAESGVLSSGADDSDDEVAAVTESAVKGTYAERANAAGDHGGDEGALDALLPDTGGARLGLLALGLGLVATGGALVARRRNLA